MVREGQEPIAGEFKRVLVETRLGVPLEDALDGVAERMDSKDFEWVVMAIRIQREVGGNLAELLNNVAATLRERDYLRRQVQTMSAEGKLSGYILGGLPPAMLVYMLLVQRGLRDAAVHHTHGRGHPRVRRRCAPRHGRLHDEPHREGGGVDAMRSSSSEP